MMQPTLLVLAAGMGSRYGGLKQMDAFGPNGETILDYSVYDAIEAGFGKVVFVIRESFNTEFRRFFEGKFDDKVQVDYVYQEIRDVPNGSLFNIERTRPWGTAHAVWAARKIIKEPFVVINADDFYGREAFQLIADYFSSDHPDTYALVGYRLGNTLSEYGTVNRGVCATDQDARLLHIEETLKIGYDRKGKIKFPKNSGYEELHPDTPVSMNFWGFYPDYFEFCEELFKVFLTHQGQELKSEFFIPLLVEHLISAKLKSIDVLDCSDTWFGVTYPEDKPFVQQKLQELIKHKKYPYKLWN